MSGPLEGDLIRPLGLVTLYFGYAEYELDALLDTLANHRRAFAPSPKSMVGQKLTSAQEQLELLQCAEARELVEILEEGRVLFDRRNALFHSCILRGGRVTSFDGDRQHVTPDELTGLAEAIFTWKERLNAARQLRLVPLLTVSAAQSGGT